MDAAANCEALYIFYSAKEGGEIVLWRINVWRQVEFFNAFVSGKRDSWLHVDGPELTIGHEFYMHLYCA
jgi:hypothetical protein